MRFYPGIMPGNSLKSLRDTVTDIVLEKVTAEEQRQEHSDSRQRDIIYNPVPKPSESPAQPSLDEADKSLQDDSGKTHDESCDNAEHQEKIPLGKT